MSDTPRTDAVKAELAINDGYYVLADFARTLERELKEATDKAFPVKNAEIARLTADLTAARARIAELEEAWKTPAVLHAHCLRNLTPAQIAHLFGERMTEIVNQLAALTQDRARMDWLIDSLEVDIEINGAKPLDHVDWDAWNEQGGNECEATRTGWRKAIDAAMKGTK